MVTKPIRLIEKAVIDFYDEQVVGGFRRCVLCDFGPIEMTSITSRHPCEPLCGERNIRLHFHPPLTQWRFRFSP